MQKRLVSNIRNVLLSMILAGSVVACASRENPDAPMRATGEALLDQVASQLHVAKDWTAVRTFIYCNIAALGTERHVVETRLSRIEKIHVTEFPDEGSVQYRFVKSGYLPYFEFTRVVYDKQWRVSKVFAVHYVGTETLPPELINCVGSRTATPTR